MSGDGAAKELSLEEALALLAKRDAYIKQLEAVMSDVYRMAMSMSGDIQDLRAMLGLIKP